MITNLIIPVQDTESAKFEYDGTLTRDAYEAMVLDRFHKTDRQIDEFMHRDITRDFSYDVYNGYSDEDFKHNEISDNEVEVQALLLNSNKDDFLEDYFFELIDKESMFILVVNINPDGLDEDAESEIKYWLDDSMRVWEDDELDKKTKLNASPTRDLKIVLSDGNKYTLENCKIFEDYSDDRFPLYFAMVVEKITL